MFSFSCSASSQECKAPYREDSSLCCQLCPFSRGEASVEQPAELVMGLPLPSISLNSCHIPTCILKLGLKLLHPAAVRPASLDILMLRNQAFSKQYSPPAVSGFFHKGTKACSLYSTYFFFHRICNEMVYSIFFYLESQQPFPKPTHLCDSCFILAH